MIISLNNVSEQNLEIIYILVVLLLVYLSWKLMFNNKVVYTQESIDLLIKYFGDLNFKDNKTLLDLEEKLNIEMPPKEANKISKLIIKDSKHKKEIFEQYNEKHNKSYNDITTFKITANIVIDYSIKKDINIKDSIKLLYIVFSNPSIKELLDNSISEKEIINIFYDLIIGFEKRYNKRISE